MPEPITGSVTVPDTMMATDGMVDDPGGDVEGQPLEAYRGTPTDSTNAGAPHHGYATLYQTARVTSTRRRR